jgi:putative tryptophan/tyrosine transport system substrate-binding protein
MQMKRREFIGVLGGAAAWPLAARAQQPAMPVVGFINGASPEAYADRVRAFSQGLNETGYVEGRNVVVEFRWAHGKYDDLPELLTDLVQRRVDVIVANGPPAPMAKAATVTIPIVFVMAGDPVASGLVASLSHPGGNLTGITNLNLELGPKRLELLHELLPTAHSVAILVNPTNPNTETLSRDLEAAARDLGLQVHLLRASTEADFQLVFASLPQLRADGLVIGTDPFFNSQSKQFAAMATQYRIPTIFQFREFVAAGGLMAYGGSGVDGFRQAGVYSGRILKGEKPADLPVQQETKAELVLNLKTAKSLGLTFPLSLLARADEVIE